MADIYIHPHWDRRWISEYHPMRVFMLHETSIHSSTQTRCLLSLYDMLFTPRHAMAVFATTRWCPMHGEGHVPLPSNSQVLSPPAHTTVSGYNRSVYGCSEPHLKALREENTTDEEMAAKNWSFTIWKCPKLTRETLLQDGKRTEWKYPSYSHHNTEGGLVGDEGKTAKQWLAESNKLVLSILHQAKPCIGIKMIIC